MPGAFTGMGLKSPAQLKAEEDAKKSGGSWFGNLPGATKAGIAGAVNPVLGNVSAGNSASGSVAAGANALGSAYNAPYNDARDANNQAGKDAEALGNKAFDMSQQGIGRALDQSIPAARQWNKTYEGDGALAGQGALEKLYDERKSGTNPALENDRLEGQRAIDNAFAARGLQNSGAALRATGNLNANISAENQRQLASLASGAQGAAETRLGGAFDRISGLGNQRAGIVQQGTQGGIDNYTAGQLGGINARLAASNVGLQQRKDTVGLGAQVLGGLTGAFTG